MTPEALKDAIKYDPITGIFTRRKNGRQIGTLKKNGYIEISVGRNRQYAHRAAWAYIHGSWPAASIDHINRDRTDNRIANLRVATPAQNKLNTPPQVNNKSGHKGVFWFARTRKWMTYIDVDHRRIHLGYFTDKNDAIATREAAALRYYGEFAEAA